MNLIICSTPLQILIAERIIDLHSSEKFYGVLYAYPNMLTDKHKYYFNRLASKCTHAEILFCKESSGGRLTTLLNTLSLIIKGIKLYPIHKIFIASIDIIDLQCFIHFHKNAEIKTFDDGTLNLSPTAFEQMMNKPRGTVLRMLNILNHKEILERSTEHFSIYKLPNVIGKSTHIKLISENYTELNSNRTSYIKTIFLGQPIYKFNDKYPLNHDEVVTKKCLVNYPVDEYLPHPRENYRIPNIQYIDTQYIFEDYITKELQANPNTLFRIYGFCSSGMLNLVGTPRIEMVAIKPSDCPENLIEVYDIFSKSGIKILNLQI